MKARLIALAAPAALAVAVIAPVALSAYQLTVATYVMIYTIICVGLVLMTGIAGMVSFGQAAFVGIGAYATGYLTTALGWSPWFGLVAAIGSVGVLALAIGAVTVRMSGHYLALATLCFCISTYFLLGNTEAVGQFNGMAGIPPVTIGSFALRSERAGYWLVLAGVALAIWWSRRILDSRSGRVLRSLRTGPAIAETFGASAQAHRLLAFVAAAVLAALAGWLYAHVQRFLNPTPFGVQASIEFLFMTVIGGSAHVWGALLGASLVTIAKQELQSVLQPLFGATTRLEMLAFAAIMIVVLAKTRRGLWPFIQQAAGGSSVTPRAVTPAPLPNPRVRPSIGFPILTASHMRKVFGGLVAVDDVSFEIRSGEILGLLGPNGAGKSTLFNLISGALTASGGEITFLGTRIRKVQARDMCRRGMARTFQHVKIVPDMTLIENVAIGATHLGHCGVGRATLGLDRDEERRLLGWSMHLLQRVGLGDKAWDLAGSLPLGHQRILEIARALASDPALLLLDEPAAGLRANEKAELAALLEQLRGEHLSILVVEHDMEFVSRVADRLMVMNFGRRIALGLPAEVRADPDVQDAYLGAAA